MENGKCRSFLYHSKNNSRTSKDTSCSHYKRVGHLSGIHDKYARFDENTTIIGCEETCTQDDKCDFIICNNRNRYHYFKKLIVKDLEIITDKQEDFLTQHKNGK